MRAFTVLLDAWRHRDKLGNSEKARELAAFLPAALEIQEAPPNPLAKWVSRSLMALFSGALVWACFGEVNIVASAEGKIIPGSRVKEIQPLEKAVVKRILVSDGEMVRKGQALIELDSTSTVADEKRIAGEIDSARFRLAVGDAFLKLLDMLPEEQKKIAVNSVTLSNIPEATEQTILLHKRLLWQQWLQFDAQIQALKSSLVKTQAQTDGTREVINKLEQTLPIIKKRTATMKVLHSKNFASETDYLQLEQERIQQTQDLATERQRLNQLLATQDEVQQQINALAAQTYAQQLAEMAENQRQIAALREELAKASDLNSRQILYSPVSGQVQDLAINTVGGVVTEAQKLMLIVPDEEHLEVKVFLENKDIGFVQENMQAEIKVHTFPFTKYGVVNAEVITVSDDATVDEQQGLVYGMQLLMKKNSIRVNDKLVKLIPGMAVTAEVQIGKRRIIEFFMAPLLRYQQESIRER
ncbi:HlyD family type I secretion periplasmic adaptor subunit [Microbulbifer sp. TYP-18]|uniref:HlyD family type I secretion periplasmic adaptor subunit n=1 Tax=Microbulbifer sp. TYP-18 TaxID=3230024 RepID=UPI0034C6D0AB